MTTQTAATLRDAETDLAVLERVRGTVWANVVHYSAGLEGLPRLPYDPDAIEAALGRLEAARLIVVHDGDHVSHTAEGRLRMAVLTYDDCPDSVQTLSEGVDTPDGRRAYRRAVRAVLYAPVAAWAWCPTCRGTRREPEYAHPVWTASAEEHWGVPEGTRVGDQPCRRCGARGIVPFADVAAGILVADGVS